MDTDAEIVERSRYGPTAFGELYDRHGPDVYRYAARRAGDFVAEDVMSETFLIAFEGRFDFVGPAGAVRPWLFGIATNLLRRHHRAEARVLRALVKLGGRIEEPDLLGAVDDRLDAPGNQARIGRALQDLPAIDRDAILLLVWAGLSYEDIATATGVPVGTVRSRINRARRKLRMNLNLTLSDKEDDHGRSAAAPRHA